VALGGLYVAPDALQQNMIRARTWILHNRPDRLDGTLGGHHLVPTGAQHQLRVRIPAGPNTVSEIGQVSPDLE
jgi:hypothetical protein